ncbi:hypothetical protein FRC04_002179 [Tulasnella sp. 424]|nr:hypothetical protein FRC04_002179 [Tulasnella sp. 424]KAG8967821.1 hypothetical protein FRC05_001917 [Tulasnella sp. 425]
MSQLDFSEGEHLDAMSSISTTWTDSTGTASPPLNPAASLQNSTEGKKHPTFYFSDFINVQVEHMVYSFPSALINSSNLKETVKGLRGNEYLSLEGIPHHEVQAFLDVADARLVSGDQHFTFQQWASALSVANHLQVAEISTYVAKSIEDGLNRLDPFDCIQAAEIYRVQDWLLQPFRRICERRDPLSPSEMLLLGLDRAGAMARARENLMRTIYSKGLFNALYGSSELSPSAQTTLASNALQAVKGESLLCQLPSEQQLTGGARDDHQKDLPQSRDVF